ncbi:hypothetical protein Acr_24g0003340 [Actinidia rufa]|uniref:Uncharacterized protein n=1 Tax=Actinidia rufa TaxID=165716 RepID=A0A7J0GUC3_9ERIC|nr:hypothetical protein Acr_24g0003340 [Actinidia rufa]
MSMDGRRNSSSLGGDDCEFSPEISMDAGVPRVPRAWGTLGKCCNKQYVLSTTEQQRVNRILDSLVKEDTFTIKEVVESKSFRRGIRIDMKKLTQKAKKYGSKHTTSVPKGTIISEKRPQDEVPDILPTKKVKSAADLKGKRTTSPPEVKKNTKVTSSKIASKGARTTMAPGEGTSANPNDVLGLNASMLKNPIVAEIFFEGMIPSFDREEVSKLDLDWAIEDLRKMKEDRDATVERLEKEFAELQKKEVLAKKSTIKEYKSSDDLHEVVETPSPPRLLHMRYVLHMTFSYRHSDIHGISFHTWLADDCAVVFSHGSPFFIYKRPLIIYYKGVTTLYLLEIEL